MEQSYASRSQRVDLLGDDCEEIGNKKKSYGAIARGFAQRKAPAVLLAGLPSSQTQCKKMVLTISTQAKNRLIIEKENYGDN